MNETGGELEEKGKPGRLIDGVWVEALRFPESYSWDEEPSDLIDRLALNWGCVPVLGWALAIWRMEKSEFFHRLDDAQVSWEREMLSRPRIDPSIWGPDPRKVELAQVMARSFVENAKWPNDHFIPEDHFGAAIVGPGGHDMHEVEAMMDIESHLGIKPIPDQELDCWYRKTLSEVVDILLAKPRERQGAGRISITDSGSA